jgi:hypothetical protein
VNDVSGLAFDPDGGGPTRIRAPTPVVHYKDDVAGDALRIEPRIEVSVMIAKR